MAIVAMLGFDDRTVFNGLAINDPIYNLQYPNLFKTPIDAKTIPLAQYVGQYYTNMTCRTFNDPDGVQTIGMGYYPSTYNNGVSQTNQLLVGPPLNEPSLDKSGTWVFGTVVLCPYFPNSQAVLSVIGDADNRVKNVPILAYQWTQVSNPLNNITANTAVYVEFVIDWVNKRIEGWVDGVFVNATTFDTNPVAYIGNAQEAKYWAYASDASTSAWWQANYPNLPGYQYHPLYNHVYFAINKAGEANPTPRLGPVRVRPVAVSSVDSVGDMVPVGAPDNVTAANGAITLGAMPTVSTKLDSAGGKGVYHFTPPTLAANEYSVRAFQVDVYTYKERDAAANAVVSVGDPDGKTPDFLLTENDSIRREGFCMDKTFGGAAWTPTAISKVTVSLNSVSNLV